MAKLNARVNPRPRKYATEADKQAAYRDRYAVFDVRLVKETEQTLTKIADALGTSRNEVVNSIINFGLLNRDWFKLGLFGKRLPHASDKAVKTRNAGDDE